jgi:ribosome-associated heat shock protein Hsp15
MRGPAPVAQQLYEETADSLAQRQQLAEQRRLARSRPTHCRRHDGRPTKRDRRSIDQVRSSWGERWSASLDDLKR